MGDEVTAVLRRVAAALPGGGEFRPGQLEMALAVAHAVNVRRHLVVQAGTGTGKSLAYLIPSALSGQKVVVATATKALQDQLAQKDLPMVAQGADSDLTFAVLKGRSNYVCRQRIDEISGSGQQLSLDGDVTDGMPQVPGDAGQIGEQVVRLLRWAEGTTVGDRAELEFEPDARAWAAVSTTARECPGSFRCPAGRECFAEGARSRAAAADVVVVNTHLYGAHLASGSAVLPPHDVVVFDEAHEIEDVMTSSLGVELGPGRFRTLATAARSLVGSAPGATAAVDQLFDMADRWHQALGPWVGRRVTELPGAGSTPDAALGSPERDDRERDDRERDDRERYDRERYDREPLRLELGLSAPSLDHDRRNRTDGGPTVDAAGGPRVAEVVALAAGRVSRIIDQLRQAERQGDSDRSGTVRARRDRTLLAAGHLASDLAHLIASGDDEVVWVEGGDRQRSLRVSPIEIGPLLSERLWGSVTAVLTSATVPVGLVDRLGLLANETDCLDVGSPFDYQSHAMLYVAKTLPDRRRPESEPALHDELQTLIEAAGGRTLALFTSWRAMSAAAAALIPRLEQKVLTQSDLPKPALIEAFRSDESACLFATLGFWQGVDIPGRTLSLVTIDRIPFPRPDDPVLQARRDRAGSRAFFVVDLPRAGTLLAQGVGRLIRSAGDRGAVAVLDSRLANARYRDVLLARVPPMRRSLDRSEVIAFLRGLEGLAVVQPSGGEPGGT